MINYDLLNRSIVYYKNLGYKRIEVPWYVPKEIMNITYNSVNLKDNYFLLKSGEELVASGEQSFLYLYKKGILSMGEFQTITPCFRNDIEDSTHVKSFLKNELIISGTTSVIMLDKIIDNAYTFFSEEVLNKNLLTIIKNSDNGYDIEYKGIELGSYGIRSCSFLDWVYGTGLAEPRFSIAMTL